MNGGILDPDRSWVLVGNGPSATARSLGRIIDAHDCIVRFNHYVTAGYEEQIGARCTHWATHGCPVIGKDKQVKIIVPPTDAAQPNYAMIINHKIPCPRGIDLGGSANAPAEVMAELREKLGKLPSTGIATIYWLIKFAGVRKVHLVGFDSFQKRKTRRHHYWDPAIYKQPAEHDADAEMRMIRHWSIVGRVAMLT